MYSFAKGIYISNSLEHTIQLPSLSFMKSIIMTQIPRTQESKDGVKRYKSPIPAKNSFIFWGKRSKQTNNTEPEYYCSFKTLDDFFAVLIDFLYFWLFLQLQQIHLLFLFLLSNE